MDYKVTVADKATAKQVERAMETLVADDGSGGSNLRKLVEEIAMVFDVDAKDIKATATPPLMEAPKNSNLMDQCSLVAPAVGTFAALGVATITVFWNS